MDLEAVRKLAIDLPAVAYAGRPMLADMRAETLLLAKYYILTRYPDAPDDGDIRFAYSTQEALAVIETAQRLAD